MKSEKEQLNALEDLFQQKRFSDALEVAIKASTDYPNSFQIKFLYVRTLMQLNKLAEAEEVLKELMSIYPNNINLLLECGNLAVIQNKFDEGNEFYNKILFLDPFNIDAKDSIEKIKLIKKGVLSSKAIGDSFSNQNKKLQSADTLPEFDSRTLRDILDEEPLPPPPPPPTPEMKKGTTNEQKPELLPSPPSPPAPEMEKIPEMNEIPEVDTDEETWTVGMSQEKMQKQEINETEAPQSIYSSEEIISLPDVEGDIPVYEVPSVPELEKKPEKIEEYDQEEEEYQQPLTEETSGSSSIPEAEPGLTAVPPPIPNVTDDSDIPETPNEMEQVLESQEPEEMMQEAEAPWQEEPETDETGFITESAAQLYVKQGLLDDALEIYKKLYDSQKENRFLTKIDELKRVLVSQKKIRVLNELLEHIRLKGEKIV